MNLNTKAMLVDLSISYWTARKYDRKASREITEKHKISENALRTRKNLMMDAPSYDAIPAASGAARSEHYHLTLPWADEGARILSAAKYFGYMEAMREKRTVFEQAVRVFIGQYPTLYTASKENLKTLWKVEDFPTGKDLERRFSFNIRIAPLPDGADFRVALGDEEIDDIRQQIEKDTQEAVSVATADLFKRMHAPVKRMVERLSNTKTVIRDSLVENLREICEQIPAFNFTDDPKVEELRDKIKTTLTIYTPKELRDSARTRSKIAKEAKRIESDLAAFMGVSN